ncbi:serine threonine protein kinase [Stylonychia lemnae]|uniref:Serine threonine protein kinase n=1 Tax=Stylonychia lemnae TaxID=5949 RepID=A0A078A371_STYLE|nr:serine threonine protein kinase [Stylonychia lemnae]|eukprot:CDW76617.1 serine threonine protein kinase [Stylonychia lemnae]
MSTFQFSAQGKFESLLQKICIIEHPPLKKQYSFKKKLGKGGQAQVDLYHANEDPDDEYAVKTFQIKLKDNTSEIYREIQFLRELEICNNIVQLHSVYREIDKIHLVMSFAKYGPLIDHLYNNKLLVENDIKVIMGQLILAVDLMHKKGIIHRDIKPDNILVVNQDNLQVCIADLGLSCKVSENEILAKKCGTPGYVAPEILMGKNTSLKSDIFSLGCLFYNLLTGQVLFWGQNKKEILKSNQYANPWKIIDSDELSISQECMELLKWMLHRDPNQRPSTEECLNQDREALQNSLWVNKFASNARKNPRQLYDELILQPELHSFIYAPNFYRPDQNSFWQSMNEGDMSCGGGLTRKRDMSNPHSKDNFKICYSKALQNARLSNSPCNTIKNNWSSFGKDNYDFKTAAAQKLFEIKPQGAVAALHDQVLQLSSPLNAKRVQLQRLEEQKEEDEETFQFRHDDFEEYPIQKYQFQHAQDIQLKLKNRIEIDRVLNYDKSLWYKNQRDKQVLVRGYTFENIGRKMIL